MLWRCQIAGSTLETVFWHEAVAAAVVGDDVVDSDDRYTLQPSVMVALFSIDSIRSLNGQLTWSPGSLIASGPLTDAR